MEIGLSDDEEKEREKKGQMTKTKGRMPERRAPLGAGDDEDEDEDETVEAARLRMARKYLNKVDELQRGNIFSVPSMHCFLSLSLSLLFHVFFSSPSA